MSLYISSAKLQNNKLKSTVRYGVVMSRDKYVSCAIGFSTV